MSPRPILFACAGLVVACVAMACTDDLRIGAEAADSGAITDGATDGSTTQNDGSSAVDSGNGAGDGAGPGVDGGADATLPLEDGGCGVVIAQEGAVVPIQVMMDAVPQEMGGMLVPGTYVLTAYRVHGAGPQGTGNVRETLVLTGTNTVGAMKRLSELSDTTGAFSAHGPFGEHFTFMGDNNTPVLFRTRDCPNDNLQQTVEYTVAGTTLTLLDEDTFTERTYLRIR